MMKISLVIVGTVALFIGIQADLIDEYKAKVVKKRLMDVYRKECIKHAKIEEQIVLDAKHKGIFPDDPKLKCYGLCMWKKLGLQNEKGELQLDIIREKLEQKIEDKEKADEILKKCAIQKDTPENTAFDAMICFYIENMSRINIPHYLYVAKQNSLSKLYHRECLSVSHINPELITKARKGDFCDDAAFKEHIYCFSKKASYQNEAGEIQPDVVKARLVAEIRNPEIAHELIAKCLIQKDTPQETAFQIIKCYYEVTHTSLA